MPSYTHGGRTDRKCPTRHFEHFERKRCVEYMRIGSTIYEVCRQAHGRNFEHILGFKVTVITLMLSSDDKCSYFDVISGKNGLNILRAYLAPYDEISFDMSTEKCGSLHVELRFP
jgi:hypothetical protein